MLILIIVTGVFVGQCGNIQERLQNFISGKWNLSDNYDLQAQSREDRAEARDGRCHWLQQHI